MDRQQGSAPLDRQRWLIAVSEYAGVSGYFGGIGRRYANLVPALARTGVQVDLLVVSSSFVTSPAPDDGVTLLTHRTQRGPLGRAALLVGALAVRRQYRRNAYHRVIVPEWRGLGALLPRNAPLTTNLVTSAELILGIADESPGRGLRRLASRLQIALERRQLLRSSSWWANSRAILHWNAARVRSHPPAGVVANSIDADAVRMLAATSALPAGWPSSATRTILFVGRTERRKGIEATMLAFADLAAELSDVVLVVAGGSGGHPLLTREQLLHTVGASIADRIVFLGDVPGPELFRAMAEATVVTTPSLWEAFGNAALEAKAVGSALVVTTGSGFDDFCTDGVDSMMVPPGDGASLADALRRVLGEPDLAASLRDGALLEVANHNPDEVARELVATLDRLTLTPRDPVGRAR